MQNVLEKRELVSGFPRAAVEILLGRRIKAAHSGATSGWLLTKVGAKRYGVPESAERNLRLEICQGGCKKVLYFQKKCFIHEGKRNMKADFVLYFFPFSSCMLSQKRL